jgi:eukaryotic-like serine/threonine-protein kinase
MPGCPARDQWLHFLEDRLPAAEQRELEAHAQDCGACQRLLEELTQPAANSAATFHASPNGTAMSRIMPPLDEGYCDYLAQLLQDRQTSDVPKDEPRELSASLPVVPGYELLEELGRGGMGVVFKARQTGLNRLVALKMVLGGHQGDPERLSRFRREAEAVAQLQHPHIVQIHEIGTLEGQPFFAMEYVPGGSLDRKLQGQPQPPCDAAALVRTLAEAMQAAHDRGIIHRDLKPANVLLSLSRAPEARASEEATRASGARLNEALPKITDFGLAKRLEDEGQTRTGEIIGTPSYMAPEQAAGTPSHSPPCQGGDGGVGPAADIYALGAILYEMLTGRPPFKGITPMETVLQVLAEQPVPPRRLMPMLPRDLETICLKCLHKEKSRRYLTAQELAEDLQRFLDKRPILARPAGQLERTWRWCRRNPALASLAGLLLLAVIGLAVGFALLWQSNDQLAEAQQKTQTALAAEAKRGRQARDVLEAMTSWMMEDLLARQHHLKETDKVLLRQAIARYRELATEAGNTAANQAEVAQASLRVADMLSRLGEMAEAEASYLHVIQQYQQMLRTAPRDTLSQKSLAGAYFNLGNLYQIRGALPEARAAFEQSQALYSRLVADHPGKADFAADLAISHNAVGMILLQSNDARAAQTHLQEALRLFRALDRDHPANPEWRYRFSMTLQLAAEVYAKQNDMAKARALSAEGDAMAEALVAQNPDSSYRETWVRGLIRHAELLLKLGETGAAQAKWEEANRQAERLVRDFPAVPDLRNLWGNVLYKLGALYSATGETARAVACLQQAQALYARFVEENPAAAQPRADLFNTHIQLGLAQEKRQELTAARQAYTAAERLQRQQLVHNPKDARCLAHLTIACRCQGNAARKAGERDKALEWYGQAITLSEAALQQEPSLEAAREGLFRSCMGRAHLFTGLRRYQEAMADWNQAERVYSISQPLLPTERVARALALVHAGDRDRAVAETETMTQFTDMTGELHFVLARIWAVAARRTEGDAARREAYVAHALAQLRKTEALFRSEADRQRLRTEPDFALLRQRPDFQKLVEEMTPRP